MTKGEID